MPIYITSNSTGPGVRVDLGATASQSVVVAQGVVVGATDNAVAILGSGVGQSAFIHGFAGAQSQPVIRLNGADGFVGVGATGVIEALEPHLDSISTAAIYFGSNGALSNYGMIRGDWTVGFVGAATIVNGGVIEAYGSTAINAFGDASITNTGDIIGAGASGAIAIGGALTLNNSGAIQSSAQAISVYAALDKSVNAYNSGAIVGGAAYDAFLLSNGGAMTFTNAGSVVAGAAAIRVGYVTNARIENSGEMRGAQSVVTAGGDDTVVNRGSLWGDVVLSGGEDFLDNRAGAVEGDVNLGDGIDVLDNLGGVINGAIFGGLGNDTFRLGAGIEVVDGGGDMDAIDFRGAPAVQVSLDGSVEGAGHAAGDDYTAVENIYGSYYADLLVGSSVANTLRGYGGSDVMDGGAGADKMVGGNGIDMLTGGNGSDIYVYDKLSEIGDLISDFGSSTGNHDVFNIRASAFGGGLVAGALAATLFQSRADNLAQDADDRFIFRTTDRTLWFDADGNAAGAAVMVADMQAGATVVANDIVII